MNWEVIKVQIFSEDLVDSQAWKDVNAAYLSVMKPNLKPAIILIWKDM